MDLDTGNMLTVIGLVFGLCTQAVLTVNWMNKKFDEHRNIIEERYRDTENALNHLNERINKVKDEYVKRVDLDRDLSVINTSLSSIKIDIHRQTAEMNSRMDRLIKILLDTRRSDSNNNSG